jgi:hypothetical protein
MAMAKFVLTVPAEIISLAQKVAKIENTVFLLCLLILLLQNKTIKKTLF